VKKIAILVTGVGGQGVILASDIISETALAAGYDVKKTDAIGMAQRGGSVTSHVRIARKVWSPLIEKGKADILLAFEKLEAARWAFYLCPGGIAIINNHALPPLAVSLGNEKYPTDEDIANIIKQRTNRTYFVDGTRHARELGNTRIINMLMLGCASLFTPLKVQMWKDTISNYMKAEVRQVNLDAFNRGRKEIRNVHR
jgi:indolepyruvate ferredoxin oxidoreductase beta subunit